MARLAPTATGDIPQDDLKGVCDQFRPEHSRLFWDNGHFHRHTAVRDLAEGSGSLFVKPVNPSNLSPQVLRSECR